MSRFKVGDVVRATEDARPDCVANHVGVVMYLDDDGDANVTFYGTDVVCMYMFDTELELVEDGHD